MVGIRMGSSAKSPSSKEKPKNYFGLIKFVLKVAGVNIDGNDSAAYRIYSIAVILFFNTFFLILDFMELFKHEFAVIAEDMLLYTFSFCLATVKSIIVIVKRNKFAKLLNKLEEEPFTPDPNRGGELDEKLIRECIWLTTAQTFAYWIVASVSIIVSMFIALFKRARTSDYNDWILPYGPLTALNITYSPNYEITWTYQSICAWYNAIQFTSVDLITAAVLAHISYQFRILQVNLRGLLRISYEKMLKETGSANLFPGAIDDIDGSLIPWKYLKQSLKEAINYHLAIINIAQEMETLFSSLLLTVFLSTLGIIGCMVYHVSTVSGGNSTLLLISGAEILCACFQVALVCYWSEQVMFQSQEVGRAAYEVNFLGTDLRFQKALALIIQRSQNPTYLTAGKFTIVSLTTFTWIMRTSYSAFMMLRKTRD